MFSISLESCEVNKFREEALMFVDKVNTVLESLGSDSNVSIGDLETKVLEAMRSLDQMLLKISVSKQASE